MNDVEMVAILLGSLNDARDGWRDVDGGVRGKKDSRDLWGSELWHATCPARCRIDRDPRACRSVFAELERCLGEMRRLGKQQAVEGVGLHRVYWHTSQWFLEGRVAIKRDPVRVTVKGGRSVFLLDGDGARVCRMQRVVYRHRDVRERIAWLGVGWLAGRMRFVSLPADLRPGVAPVSRAA